jgi:hypothetical protein
LIYSTKGKEDFLGTLSLENGDRVCETAMIRIMVKEVVTAEMPAVTAVVAAEMAAVTAAVAAEMAAVTPVVAAVTAWLGRRLHGDSCGSGGAVMDGVTLLCLRWWKLQ